MLRWVLDRYSVYTDVRFDCRLFRICVVHGNKYCPGHFLYDRIYIVMGSWCEAGTGKFIPSEVQASLNEQYEYGDILYGPVVASDGTMVESSYGTSLGRLKQWVTFLRNCGGFKIW